VIVLLLGALGVAFFAFLRIRGVPPAPSAEIDAASRARLAEILREAEEQAPGEAEERMPAEPGSE